MLRSKYTIIVIVVLLAGGVAYYFRPSDGLPAPTPSLVFEGNTADLRSTNIIATLDVPIEQGKNSIWCASFLAAWKQLEEDLTKEVPALTNPPVMLQQLNTAPDPRPHINPKNMYTAAGWNQEGILDTIHKDMARQFPEKAPPEFPGIAPGSFVAYAYLESDIRFNIPYFQNREPLKFINSDGTSTEVTSFGILDEVGYDNDVLRRQVNVLHRLMDENNMMIVRECVVDLDTTSTDEQIILAMIEPKATLQETLEDVESKIAAKKELAYGLGDLDSNDVLLVPDMVYDLEHQFQPLLGKYFSNSTMPNQRIDVAQQDITFSLTRSGAELQSEAKLYMASGPAYYVFDRPFLLYMKKRDADLPYFVMWIDNAELLCKWTQENN